MKFKYFPMLFRIDDRTKLILKFLSFLSSPQKGSLCSLLTFISLSDQMFHLNVVKTDSVKYLILFLFVLPGGLKIFFL